MTVTKHYEFISNSPNPPVNVFLLQKISHSASSAYNVKKGIRCNYIPNRKALAQVFIEKT